MHTYILAPVVYFLTVICVCLHAYCKHLVQCALYFEKRRRVKQGK